MTTSLYRLLETLQWDYFVKQLSDSYVIVSLSLTNMVFTWHSAHFNHFDTASYLLDVGSGVCITWSCTAEITKQRAGMH